MESIYKNRPLFDCRPDHIFWSVNGVAYAPIGKSDPQVFRYDYQFLSTKFRRFDEEVRAGVTALHARAGKSLAICISGRDSEVIARAAAQAGIPAKLYFLRMWGVNDWQLPIVEDIARDTQQELVVVYLDRDHFFLEVMLRSFNLMHVYKPTYLCLPYLFENIPHHELIVLGEGDVSKDNQNYEKFFPAGSQGVPIMSTEIAYRVWAQANGRHGEYYFHSSTPGLVLSAYFDPLVEFAAPQIFTEKMYRAYWPELRFDGKTDNWEQERRINTFIIKRLRSLRLNLDQNIGCLVPHQSFQRGE